MSYTIEEKNLERQHLLAEFLNPVSLNALKNISLPKEATILDIGCGLGDTTLMLNERFPNSNITGLDGRPAHRSGARRDAAHRAGLHRAGDR